MAQSPLPIAIFVVFVAGGAVGGTAAALVMRTQVEHPDGRDQQPGPHDRERAKRTSTQSLTTSLGDVGAPRSVSSGGEAVPEAPASAPAFTDDGDPGTGAWLADSLTQLEQKYQAMMEREAKPVLVASANPVPSAHETSAVDQTAALNPHLLGAAELKRSPTTVPTASQPEPAVDAAEPPQNYVAQTNITQNNTSTTHVTQVNQTVLMGYVPLLVPVPATQGQATPGSAPTVAPTTTPWVGLSPWAPIDMSRHNNPWKSSRFP